MSPPPVLTGNLPSMCETPSFVTLAPLP
jgi:hypothetical protein